MSGVTFQLFLTALQVIGAGAATVAAPLVAKRLKNYNRLRITVYGVEGDDNVRGLVNIAKENKENAIKMSKRIDKLEKENKEIREELDTIKKQQESDEDI